MRGTVVGSARTWPEFRLIPGAGQMVLEARRLGLLTILATNQPDVARGLLSPSLLDDFHRRLQQEIPLDGLEVCCEDGQHRRRKPNPGMILDAAERWNLDLPRSYFLGDRRNDMLAAQAAGVRPILLRTVYNSDECEDFPDLLSIGKLSELAELLKSQTAPRGHNPF